MKINKEVFAYDKRRHQYFPPNGTLDGTFDQLQAAGCIQCELEQLRVLFIGLQSATRGNVCDGCPVWSQKGPACAAFSQYHSAARAVREDSERSLIKATTPQTNSGNPELSCMSMKMIAEKLGISLSEARRRKAAGTL